MRTCILIPCYNEAINIGNVVKGALSYIKDVVVVDDGSTDGTGDVAERLGAFVIRHPENRGKGEALRTGFGYIIEKKNWDEVIIIDGDGQHDWNEIPRFIETRERLNASIIIGDRMSSRDSPKDMPFNRWLTNKATSCIISRITKQKIYDSQCGYRLIGTDIINDLKLQTSKFDTESEILIKSAKKGYRIISLPIKSIYRGETSHINPLKDTIRFIKLIYGAIFRN